MIGKSYIYKTFAKILLNDKKLCKILSTYDIIIPIPIHKKRKNARGYDQSALIAKEIARNIDKIKYANALKKIKNTKRQSSLQKIERMQNVKHAYQVINKQIIENKKIILFDDIYTTGSTANEGAKILKEKGAKEILVLSLVGASSRSPNYEEIRIGGTNGRISRKYIRLCKSRLHRLCSHD